VLTAQLRPKYLVRIEERIYIADESDEMFRSQSRIPEVAEPIAATTWFEVEIHEAFLNVIDRESRDVVTVIEVLSPSNKAPGPGRERFEQKKREIMYSPSH
jgi:hypothetical protein